MILYMLIDGPQEDRNDMIEKTLLRVGRGDKDAIGELYLLIKDAVYAYALSKLGSTSDAEDVLHDTVVKIYRYAPRYISQGKPMAWIITIAGNIIKRTKELNARHITYDDALADKESPIQSVENAVAERDLADILLSELSEEDREIVVLHSMWGMKHREIADYLGRPLSTVLSKYNRAIQKLKKIAEEVV